MLKQVQVTYGGRLCLVRGIAFTVMTLYDYLLLCLMVGPS